MEAHARIALVGAGATAGNHARAISESDYADLAVIVDTDRKRVRPAVERLACAFSQFLNEAGACDTVIIATSIAGYDGAACALLELGKPTLVEKPVTPASGRAGHSSPARRGAACS
jgi:predicted dehydrogenase